MLEGLREVGHDWLMATLGDVLPALLPEGSPIAKAAEQELRLIESALARTSGGAAAQEAAQEAAQVSQGLRRRR